jgi:hypothetical protein
MQPRSSQVGLGLAEPDSSQASLCLLSHGQVSKILIRGVAKGGRKYTDFVSARGEAAALRAFAWFLSDGICTTGDAGKNSIQLAGNLICP